MADSEPDYVNALGKYGKVDATPVRKEGGGSDVFLPQRNALAGINDHNKAVQAIAELLLKRTEAEQTLDLQNRKNIKNLRELVEKYSPGEKQGELLIAELDKMEEELKTARSETHKLDREIARETSLATLRRESFESRWKLFRQMLERESIASIMGALLMMFITLAIITGMFTGIAAPDILGNAFLVILGYFFGQSVQRAQQEQ
jgi:hypothetical protein